MVRARLPKWQAQLIGDARDLYGVHDPTGQAARLEFGNKQAVGTPWQSVNVDAVDLAVIDDDALKQLGEPLSKSWIGIGQFVCQFIAYSLDLVIGHLPANIFLLGLQLREPLPAILTKLPAIARA